MNKLFLRSQAALHTLQTDYKRPLYEAIDWGNPLIAVLGARGVGKTTLLLQRLKALDLPRSRPSTLTSAICTSRKTVCLILRKRS